MLKKTISIVMCVALLLASITTFAATGDEVSVNENPTFLGSTLDSNAQLVTFSEATKTGSWGSSSLHGGSFYVHDSSAKVVYSKTIEESGNYSAQIFSVANSDCADYVKAELSVNGVLSAAIKLDQKSGSAGWYEITTMDFKKGDVVEIQLTQVSSGYYLRASNACFVMNEYEEVNGNPEYLGTSAETFAQHVTFEEATKTGSWASSSIGGGSFYSDSGAVASVKYSKTFTTSGSYSAQIYSPAYNTKSSTEYAKAQFIVNGIVCTAIKLDQKNGSTGWYEIHFMDIKAGDVVDIVLTNEGGTATLRASNVRFVLLVNETPNYIGTAADEMAQILEFTDAVKTGNWYTSSIGGGSQYSESGATASVKFTKTVTTKGDYSVQIFSPAYNNSSATEYAKAEVAVNGVSYAAIKMNQKTGSTGWYEIGSMNFNAGDVVEVLLTNKGTGKCLRVSNVRFVLPENENPIFVGDGADKTAQLATFDDATKTGDWLTSGLYGTSYYSTSSNASVVYSQEITESGKYSVQIFSPAHEENTDYAQVGLFVNDEPTAVIKIDEKNDNGGWYEIGTLNFESGDDVKIKLVKKGTGLYLRAANVRFVPLVNSITVTDGSSSLLVLYLDDVCDDIGTVLYAEYDDAGEMVFVQQYKPGHTMVVNKNLSQNKYRLFFWESLETMVPVVKSVDETE